jgi:hypothetical protein
MVVASDLFSGLGATLGDIASIRRTVNNLASGRTVASAWLGVKASYSDADSAAIFAVKNITTTNVAGTGQVEDDGTSDGSAVIRFDLTNANTILPTAGKSYYYGIKIKLDSGDELTIEQGTCAWQSAVVQAT